MVPLVAAIALVGELGRQAAMRYSSDIRDYFETKPNTDIHIDLLKKLFPKVSVKQIQSTMSRLKYADVRYVTVQRGKVWRLNTGSNISPRPQRVKAREMLPEHEERSTVEVRVNDRPSASWLADGEPEWLHEFEFLGYTNEREPLLRRGDGQMFKAVQI